MGPHHGEDPLHPWDVSGLQAPDKCLNPDQSLGGSSTPWVNVDTPEPSDHGLPRTVPQRSSSSGACGFLNLLLGASVNDLSLESILEEKVLEQMSASEARQPR